MGFAVEEFQVISVYFMLLFSLFHFLLLVVQKRCVCVCVCVCKGMVFGVVALLDYP